MKLLRVTSVRPLTPRMVRISFSGEELDAVSSWPDQQLKLFFPQPGHGLPRLDDADVMRWYQAFLAVPIEARPWMRSFTVRACRAGEIDIDFVLHGAVGPASRWAASARVGDVIGRYGPDPMYRRPLGAADSYLFAGDETALPAIGTLLESLPPRARAAVYVEVEDEAEELVLTSPAAVTTTWLHRSLGSSLIGFEPPEVPEFAWLAGEAGMVRALRRHLVERGMAKGSIHFAGYWRRALSQDDDPTALDLADAQEMIDSTSSA